MECKSCFYLKYDSENRVSFYNKDSAVIEEQE